VSGRRLGRAGRARGHDDGWLIFDRRDFVSKGNIEAARRIYEAYRRGDVEGALAEMDPQVEVIPFPEVSKSPYIGHEGVRRMFEEQDGWDLLEFEASDFRANGDCVVLLGRFRARRGGALTDSSAAIAMTLREGRLVRSEAFTSWEIALRRCGFDPSAETAAVA
jgi:ketosteroid isomerase-like protein